MSAHSVILSGLWLGWALYWLIAALNAKTTQRREPRASRLMFTVPALIAAFLLMSSRSAGAFLSGRFLPDSELTLDLGIALLAAGLAFSVWARVHLGRNWSGTVTIKQEHELIRTGPYRFVRHPIYTGLLLGFVGTAIARGEWRGLVAVAILLAAVWRKAMVEERFMVEHFGDAYARYRAEVRALIPFVL